MPPTSRRAATTTAHSYDDFPVRAGEFDLRGDNSPPLSAVAPALRRLAVTAADISSYGSVEGEPELRTVLADLFGVSPANVVVTAGGSEALHLALTCVADPGDTVLLPRPAFPGFDELALLGGLRLSHYALPGPVPPARGAVATVVCTPHNPTGVLVRHADVPTAGRGWLIWDVSHTPLTGEEITDLRVDLGDADIVVFSLSKLLRLPGARVGCLVALNTDLIAAIIRAKTHLSMSVSRPSQRLAVQVLTAAGTTAELADRNHILTDQRQQLLAAVDASTAFTADPAASGTHLLMHTNDGTDAWQALRRVGVVGLPGPVFGAPGTAVRLCVAQPPHVVAEAARRVGEL